MPSLDRRDFLAMSAALALPLPPIRPSVRPSVVVVVLRGGVDGLSLVVPHGDPVYYRRRPRIALAARDVIDLDGYFGLHPMLAPLRRWWDDGNLALAPAAGFPSRLRSHLDAQARVDRWLDSRRAVRCGSFPEAARRTGVAVVDSWGWDTHLHQGGVDGAFAGRLRLLARELDALARRALVVTISEFGRTVGENAHGGTDHGHATAVLAFGRGLETRGMVGSWPGLEAPDIAVTVDVRDLVDQHA